MNKFLESLKIGAKMTTTNPLVSLPDKHPITGNMDTEMTTTNPLVSLPDEHLSNYQLIISEDISLNGRLVLVTGNMDTEMTTTNRLVSLPDEQFLAQLGISSAAPVKEPKESKIARMKPKVVKATRKLPTRDIPSYDTVNYQFGDICRGETVQLKDPNRFGVVLKVVKGRRGAAYTVEIEDGSVLENLSRNSLWKVLKHNVQMIH